jgi:hypothetical protein
MIIVLYYPKSNNIIETDKLNVIESMYYDLAMIPNVDQLKKYNKLDSLTDDIKKYINDLKKYISKIDNYIPLFDYSTKNIYLIEKEDIYQKVTLNNFRFPTNSIINLLKKTIDDLTKINSQDWIIKYIKKIQKNINFLSNFDLKILKETYTDAFLNTNPTSRDLTSCVKPSYLPYQTYQSPYYTKSELISMALNLKIIKNKKIKPWAYSDTELKKICSELAKYEISTTMLIYNQLYILYNNAKSYVQFYSLFGSYYFNSYLRNNKSIKDADLDKHIDNFLKIIKFAPAFDSNYEVYRFIENDDYISHLKIDQIYDENSFISTTRNPFYPMKDNNFGFILLKIRLKKGLTGIGLLMESYSNYQSEQEVLLPPSRLKLIEVNSDIYMGNKLAEKKIIKKYIFEYIEPISYDVITYTNNYITKKIIIPLIDFYNVEYEGSNSLEKTLNFFNSLPKYNLRRCFKSIIGSTEYNFTAYFLSQNKVYKKFFFLQRENDTNDEIYLTIQNPSNGQIELIVEIKTIISVNYYHRYSGLKNTINDDDLIHWLSGLAKALNINSIIIHGNYSSYAGIVENLMSKSDVSLLENFKVIQNIDNPDVNILNLYTADIHTYCTDLTDYIFENKKRFNNKSYIERKIPLHLIDKLKNIYFIDLVQYDSPDYQTLKKIYDKLDKLTIFEFYKIIHINYPYLIPKLQNLIILTYPKNILLPWHFYYVLNPFEYLFEKGIVKYISNIQIDKITDLIKDLQLEVKFIHDNKFRQVLV